VPSQQLQYRQLFVAGVLAVQRNQRQGNQKLTVEERFFWLLQSTRESLSYSPYINLHQQ
jgi:hypothetical protein